MDLVRFMMAKFTIAKENHKKMVTKPRTKGI
jgi:hypothetical protein